MYDVAVIGAGPAGASAARQVALEGWRVLLLERDEYPGKGNVCGGGLEEGDADLIGVPPQLIHKRIVRREHHFPWGITTLNAPHITVLRRELDRHLAEEAVAAGAELVTRTQARKVTLERPGQVSIGAADLAGGREVTFQAQLVIFADGPHTLARRTGNLGFARRPDTAAAGLVYDIEWPGEGWDHYEVHMGGSITHWGYAWIFPKRDLLNVGIWCLPSKGASHNLEANLKRFVENDARLRGRRIVLRRGAFIPAAPAERIYDTSMLAVGDAAGMVDALTGAGIANGVLAGRIAGQVACAALARHDFSADFLAEYQQRWQATPRYQMIKLQARLTRALLPLARLDGNLYAKLMQGLFLGNSLNPLQKLWLLAYPLLPPPAVASQAQAKIFKGMSSS